MYSNFRRPKLRIVIILKRVQRVLNSITRYNDVRVNIFFFFFFENCPKVDDTRVRGTRSYAKNFDNFLARIYIRKSYFRFDDDVPRDL